MNKSPIRFIYHAFQRFTFNTKKRLALLSMLAVFCAIGCGFCVPMFQMEDAEVQEKDAEQPEGIDIALATEDGVETGLKTEPDESVETDPKTELDESVETGSKTEPDESGEGVAENPEAEEGEDVDNYSSDEILAHHESEGMEKAGEAGNDAASPDDWDILLVNNRHPIPEDYEFTLGTIMGNLQCDERIIPELLEMLQEAKQDGISLEICSPYRTDERQVALFERKIKRYMKKGMSYMDAYKVAAQTVTVPGTSEHQIGLALDIYTGSYRVLDEGFGETKEGIWLREHCSEYGFILRYPKGKEYITGIEYEPWHFRYVGKTAAKVIMEQEITLEEYVEMY